MRTTAVLLSLLTMLAASGAEISPEALLQRGVTAYRSGDYTAAVTDLQAAAERYLSPAATERYVRTGTFEDLAKLETALVYLALAQARLGRQADAHGTVVRLLLAERIAPVYAGLPIEEAAEFESLVQSVAPGASLPRNGFAAASTADENAPLPPVTARTRTADGEGPPAATEATLAEERARRQRIADELMGAERARIDREREAAERAAAERTAAAEAESQRRIAAAQAEADRRVLAAQREAEEHIARMRRETDDRVAAERRAGERATSAQSGEAGAEGWRGYLATLRQAEATADAGDVAAANTIYARVATAEDAPREIIAEAAVGLYRIGAFRLAADAFRRLGQFAKGEEDLRYYYAVALYETGLYTEARKELFCALPFIDVTDDVTRYRTKIEQTARQQAMR